MKLNNLIGQNPSSSCNLFRSLERGAREGLIESHSDWKMELEYGIFHWKMQFRSVTPLNGMLEWKMIHTYILSKLLSTY
jgi:hypothetical protein